MNENTTRGAKSSPWSEETDQKAVKHRDLCPERCQGPENSYSSRLIKGGVLRKVLYVFSIYLVHRFLELPGTWQGLKGVPKKGNMMEPCCSCCSMGWGYPVARWVDGSILSLEGVTAGLGLMKESRIRERYRKGTQEE